MYAVFSDGMIAYLGDDRDLAMETLDSKDGANLNQFATLVQLSVAFATYKDAFVPEVGEDEEPSTIEQVLERLDEAGLNSENAQEVFVTLKEKASDVCTEVRSLGIKSMKTVGDGFIALGDLLKSADKEEESEGCAEDESKNEPLVD